jgi:hypothetical protein
MVGRYAGREFNNHVNSATGMCGLFWMRPPFLGPSSIFGPVLHFWIRPPFLDPSSISGPVLHFWTCPPFLKTGLVFLSRGVLTLHRPPTGLEPLRPFPGCVLLCRDVSEWTSRRRKNEHAYQLAQECKAARTLISGLISCLLSFTFLPFFTGVLLTREGVGDCCRGRSGVQHVAYRPRFDGDSQARTPQVYRKGGAQRERRDPR